MRGHEDSSWRGEERLPSERRHGGEDLAPSRSDVVRNVESGTKDRVRTMAWGVGPGGGAGRGGWVGGGWGWGWGWGGGWGAAAGRRQRLSGQCGARS